MIEQLKTLLAGRENPGARPYWFGLVREAIKVLMEQRGIGAKTLARMAGVGETVVRDIVQGKTKDVQLGTLSKIAEALGLSLIDVLPLADPMPARGFKTKLVSEIAADLWQDDVLSDRVVGQGFYGRSDVDIDANDRFAAVVTDDSADMVYPPDSIVDCLLEPGAKDLREGKHVIVYRLAKSEDTELVLGRKIEITIRGVIFDKDGKLLLASRSRNPRIEQIIDPRDPGDGIEEVQIAGLIIGSYRPE